MKVRVAIVGAGRDGSHFVQHYGADERVGEIVLVDPDKDLLKRYGAYPKVVAGYADSEAMLAKETVDIVSIHAPERVHRPVFEQAANRKLHIFCEKPLANTIEDIEAIMVAAHNNAGRKMMVGQCYRLERHSMSVKRLIDDGAIGVPVCVKTGYISDYLYFWQTEPQDNFKRPWHHITSRPMINGGTHLIDLASWLMKARPVSVYALRRPMQAGVYPGDWVSAIFRYSNDAMMHMDASFSMIAPHAPHFGLEVYGTEGSIRGETLYRFRSKEYHLRDFETREIETAKTESHAFKEEVTLFLDAIEKDEPVFVPVGEGANAAAAAIIADQAARLGQQLAIPDYRGVGG